MIRKADDEIRKKEGRVISFFSMAICFHFVLVCSDFYHNSCSFYPFLYIQIILYG